ncbi:MAG: hypothetical protein ACLFVQ_08175 [Chitinispirillaceae bacterium]
MFLASDLDRTLIYSRKAMEQLNGSVPRDLRCVEVYENENFCFTTSQAGLLIDTLLREKLLVPVTTRTQEQYGRIQLSRSYVPEWAVTCNGAVVLRNGEVDTEWDFHIKKRLAESSLSIFEMEQLIEPFLSSDWFVKKRTAESWFIYMIVKQENLLSETVESLRTLARKHQWQLSVQGRKLYLIPDCINKANALSYVCDRMKMNSFIGAGDSLLDKPLVESAAVSFIPSHGELFGQLKSGKYVNSRIRVTRSGGVFSGEEILAGASEKLGVRPDTLELKPAG